MFKITVAAMIIILVIAIIVRVFFYIDEAEANKITGNKDISQKNGSPKETP